MSEHTSPTAVEDETAYVTAKLGTRTRLEIRPQVFIPAAVLIAVFVALGAVLPQQLSSGFQGLQTAIAQHLGWRLYVAAVTAFLVFVVWLALSRHGRKRLGPHDARPHYSHLSWFAMLFSAGMGIGLLFYSVGEAITHFGVQVPPWFGAAPGSAAGARDAMTTSFFHWGLHAWAIYIVVGLALACGGVLPAGRGAGGGRRDRHARRRRERAAGAAGSLTGHGRCLAGPHAPAWSPGAPRPRPGGRALAAAAAPGQYGGPPPTTSSHPWPPSS